METRNPKIEEEIQSTLTTLKNGETIASILNTSSNEIALEFDIYGSIGLAASMQ